MKLCPECGSIIMPSKKDGATVFACSCGHSQEGSSKMSHKSTHEEKEMHLIDPEAFSTDAITKDEPCPKCDNEEAYFTIQQTRSADEPPTKFMRCKSCKHTWRDYS